jgi:hypothetical protein
VVVGCPEKLAQPCHAILAHERAVENYLDVHNFEIRSRTLKYLAHIG